MASGRVGDFWNFGTGVRFGAKVDPSQLLSWKRLANIGARSFGTSAVQKWRDAYPSRARQQATQRSATQLAIRGAEKPIDLSLPLVGDASRRSLTVAARKNRPGIGQFNDKCPAPAYHQHPSHLPTHPPQLRVLRGQFNMQATRTIIVATSLSILLLSLSAARAQNDAAPTPPAQSPGAQPAESKSDDSKQDAKKADSKKGNRPRPAARDPHSPDYVEAKELPDGDVPPSNVDGNFIVGPTHKASPDTFPQDGVPKGEIITLTMKSEDSKMYPGIAREQGTFGTPDPQNPAKLDVTTSHAAPYTRKVAVYVPKQYKPGTEAPFIVGADGPDKTLFGTLDNLIAQKRVPAMIGISISNGSGDAQGSQRGLEYDTMSGKYAEFVESEVLPLVEKECGVKLTKDPEGRATMGGSSGGSCALIMAWYHPEWYHRVLTYSGTYVNQQWPWNPETPGGAWEFHKSIIPNSAVKPLRLWLQVGDRDLLNPNSMRDEMHDWVLANERMAKVLADKGYHYQFVFCQNCGHTEGLVKSQTLPEALEYVWQGYPIEGK
jgi:enterochelin esterase family protein